MNKIAAEFTTQDWKNCMIFFGGVCCYCGKTMRKYEKITKDHLLPISKGGLTISSNIVPACAACNNDKGDADFREWFLRQPFFSQDRLNKIFKWRTMMRLVENTSENNRVFKPEITN